MDILRTCKTCGATNRNVRFYESVTSRCVECFKEMVRKNRAINIEYYREYDAKRFKTDPRRKKAVAAYLATDAGKSSAAASKKRWLEKNPSKRACHIILGNAVRDGKITKPISCSLCNTQKGRIHGHHNDYTKPLDVVWCCSTCHRKLHVELMQ